MQEIRAREICLIVFCFFGHAHFVVSNLHGSYFVDDYSGIWTKFDGIGALSAGVGVLVNLSTIIIIIVISPYVSILKKF